MPNPAAVEAFEVLQSSHQEKYKKDHNDKAQATTAVVTGAVERSPADATEAAQQQNNQYNKNNGSDAHWVISDYESKN